MREKKERVSCRHTLRVGEWSGSLALFAHATLAGKIGGGVRAKGDTLVIGSTGVIDGPVHFEGHKPPEVSPSANWLHP